MSLGGDSEVLIVQGPSMLPTIFPGSLVITKATPTYQVDDIVSFNLKEDVSDFFGGPSINRIVVHRIVDETDEGFVIQGDNNPRKDPGFPTADQIRGKVILVIPFVGEMFELLRNPIVLIATSVIAFVIQQGQKRRKKRKEKLRRIRLGLPPKFNEDLEKKPKKPDYSLFYTAFSFNILIFVIIQYSIVHEMLPLREMGDMVTGFLFRMYTASFASTLSFGIYFVFIVGLYFLTKVYEGRKNKKSKRHSKLKSGKTLELVLGKNFNPVLSISQIMWLLFILLSMFHLLAISGSLIEAVEPCDPTREIC